MLGVLGGGQLARMFVHAAQRMGYRTAVLDPDAHSPAGLVSHLHLQADYLDAKALDTLASRCAAITTEFENVPADALKRLAASIVVAPGGDAVEVCQDRLAEKTHFARCGVACAAHAAIETAEQLNAVPDALLPGILKTARLGYDGKGQVRVADRAALAAAWATLQQAPCILEQQLSLAYEVSVIVARGTSGEVVAFPPQQNLHCDGILAVTQVPAPDLTDAARREAESAAGRIATTLGYVGVLCVEFFVLADGRVLANEMAPRPHNSGHYSLDACDVSQFELQVRTMTNAPLAVPRLHSACVMLNLLGDVWLRGHDVREPDWPTVLARPGTHLHLYGKTEARRGRKMGHLTFTGSTPAAAQDAARHAASVLRLPSF